MTITRFSAEKWLAFKMFDKFSHVCKLCQTEHISMVTCGYCIMLHGVLSSANQKHAKTINSVLNDSDICYNEAYMSYNS